MSHRLQLAADFNLVKLYIAYQIYGGTRWFPIHTYSAELLQLYSRLMNDMEYINLQMIEEQYQAFINNYPDKVDIVLSHHLPSKEAFAVLENADNDYAPFYHAGLSNKLISKAPCLSN